SKRRKVYIVTEKETFEFYGKLNEIEESLRASKGIFLRIHQSFLINYKHIKGLAYDFAVMDNEERLSISEDRRKLISKQYCAMEDTFYVGM
ncbi:TPA: LytTR family transcriptional regulator DNA-binding domain-containing protein, partial [Clostridioides difficile]|nr:LytTR family transcriptional regulator DNA-binding domain-containing protein [Clostridioides difficile]